MNERRKAELVLLGATFIWGSTFPVMKIGVEDFPPITFIALRFGIASFVLFLALRKHIRKDALFPGLILGFTLFLGHGFQIVGLKYTTPSNSAFITSLYVVFTPFIAFLFFRKGLKMFDAFSLSLAVIGLYLISNAELRLNYGDALTVVAALSFAFQIVLVEYFGNLGVGLAFWQIFWNFILSTVYAGIFEGISLPSDPKVLGGIIYTGIFATALSFTLQVKYQPKVESYKAAIIYSSEPIFAHLLALAFLNDRLPPKGYLGAFLILLAVWLELYQERKNY
ncbi:EamA/RhaT family transporter [Pyrococcus furiosus DSM 3638]|uniref:EamA domain-containing protein n=3 Tax=Pyrococcus furiosus TaxID=2261 RepID=Q8U3Y4_PYRFU|nr:MULTISPECIES: DMT family transporter [Pyrococcus]AAL80441.1 hypothetical protein PF0317 [Pyrococcus furiosus DSM 3638]AFN03106.1 hypothetical protein PFC_00660 [Pyrococcus furiosus COM1]MDK2870461.1 hypothetical protein [Pyrococcus sp.]QEK78033.1 EamA/RhaT family transporter [Pyrococcus furiosus DSM 3638]